MITDFPKQPAFQIIGRIHTDFSGKFGIPRQSGLAKELQGTIVFEPEFRNRDAVRGLCDYSHIWILWQFSEAIRDSWSPTVRPPRLGGNARMGVFATRSPFRPNPIGLSAVELIKVEYHPELGPILHVAGADLMNQTPIYDIKPYLPYADCYPEAKGGFTQSVERRELTVSFPNSYLSLIPKEKQQALIKVLALDPRPSYQEDSDRVYGMEFAGFNIRFTVKESTLLVLEVHSL